MKGTKRFTAMLIAFALMLSMLPTAVMAADSALEFKVDTSAYADGVAPGSEITIPVVVVSNSGFAGTDIKVQYESKVFDFVSMAAADFGGQVGTESTLNYVYWASDYTTNTTATGTLFTITLKVKADAKEDSTTISLIDNGTANGSDLSTPLNPTLTSGDITVKYETSGLSFVNGSQTMTFAEAQDEANGVEGAKQIAKPGDDYHFVGWFSGLADSYKDDNGYYVIAPTATVTNIAGTELRPRYQTPPTEGTYNALWINGTGSYAVNVDASTLDVYVGDTDSAVLSTAIAAASGARTKLVKDMNLAKTKVTPAVAFKLDMNGFDILAGTNRIISPSASTSGNVIESSREGAEFRSNSSSGQYQYIYVSEVTVQFDRICDVNFIGKQSSQAIYLSSATKIENCNFEGYIQFVGAAGNSWMDNCSITSTSFLVMKVQDGAELTITNTTMNTSSSSTNAVIQGTSDPTNPGGTIKLGAGNKITATTNACLFGNLNTLEFTSADSTYQIKAGGALCFVSISNGVATVTVKNVKYPEGVSSAIDDTGKIIFGEPCTVTYKKDDGSIVTKTGMKGDNADLSFTYQIGNGKEYKLLGWSTDPNATEPMTEITLSGDITLYAVKARKGVMIGMDPNEYESGNVTTTYTHGDNANAFTVYNADRLDELDGLTLFGYSSDVKLVFSAEALDAIASQINGESKDMNVVLYRSTSGLSDGAKVKGQIALTYKASNEAAEQAITIPEGVEVQLRVNSQSSIGNNKKLAAYDVANPDTELATEFEIVSSSYWAYFRMPANGTFEVKALENAYVGEDQMTGNVSITVKNGDTDAIIENAAKIGDLDSLYVSNDSDGIEVRFTAAALDDIAAKVSTERVIIRVASGTPSEGAAARAELFVLDGNGNPVDFSGAVEVSINFTREADKNYRAYYIPENGDPVGLLTTLEAVNAAYNNWKATFTTTHFSAFEVRETEEVNGYSAGLNILENVVRAGGNTVNVYVDVTHDEDTYVSAGEIVIGYNAALLTPVTNNLPAGTYKVEDGQLTLEFYGAEKLLGEKFLALQFTTVDKVDAMTATEITLESAAFVNKTDAQTENLEAASITPEIVTVVINLQEYNVIKEKDDNVLFGPDKAEHGKDYEFENKDPDFNHYTYTVYATVNGQNAPVTVDASDPTQYTIAGQYITGDVTIGYTKVAKEYDVTFTGNGAADGIGRDSDKATHAAEYKFTLPEKPADSGENDVWQYSYTIQIEGNETPSHGIENQTVTIAAGSVTGNVTIEVTRVQSVYTVAVNGNDVTVTDGDEDGSYEKDEAANVTITPVPGYQYEVTATQTNGQDVTVTKNSDTSYTVSGFSSNLTITVTKTLKNAVVETYSYLTLNADGADATSLTMYLITYASDEVHAADGYTVYYGDAQMWWSDKYQAYCYLEVVEGTPGDFAAQISVKNVGDKALEYTYNVNGSSNTDAADAQLVYNMYNGEYSDFSTVGREKFLLADVNGNYKVESTDAVAIITYILNPNA